MKEIVTMPVKVSNGNKEIEIYEFEDGFCMTTEFLGRCLGYGNPTKGMGNLFNRNKTVFEPHRFILTARINPLGGRPTTFYDSEGCILAAGRSGTPEAKDFLPRFLKRLRVLAAKRMERIEAYWFSVRPWWPEIRDRVMKGEPFRVIAEAMNRSTASVRNAVRRMIQVGILQPLRAAQALIGTARKTVLRYGRKYIKDDRQLTLFEQPQTT